MSIAFSTTDEHRQRRDIERLELNVLQVKGDALDAKCRRFNALINEMIDTDPVLQKLQKAREEALVPFDEREGEFLRTHDRLAPYGRVDN